MCSCVVRKKEKETEDVTDEENKLEEKRIRQCSIIIKEAYKLTRQVDLPIQTIIMYCNQLTETKDSS